MKLPKINIPAALLLTSLSSGIFSVANAQNLYSENDNTEWWVPYKNSVAFNEALDQFGLTYQQLETTPDKFISRSDDVNDALFWQKRTMSIYKNANQGDYYIPVIEAHDNARYRTTEDGRNLAFATYYYGNASDTITIRTSSQPEDVNCYVALENTYTSVSVKYRTLLTPNGETTYTLPEKGSIIFNCSGKSEDSSLKHMDQLVPFHISSTTATYQPLFILGLTTLDEWKTMSQQVTSSGQILLFDGRTRYYASNNKAKASLNTNIQQTMRENLMNTIHYDVLNGMDGSTSLHQPNRGLNLALYNASGWSAGGGGQIAIGFGSNIPTQSSWGIWHEFGHQNQMGWSWSGLEETTVNIYSIAACRATQGEVDVKNCHENLAGNGFEWDQQAVGTFLKSGQVWDLDNDTNLFHQLMMFAQLETSWPDLYPALGKAYREINDYNQGSGKVNSKQEKVDFFVVNASKYSGHDLRKFFTRWGVDFSTDASNQIADMKLPEVIEPSETLQTTLELEKGKISVEKNLVLHNTGGRYNTGFVANSKTIGPTALVWADPDWSYTTLTVPVVDKNDRQFFIKLRGQRYGGYCDAQKLNDAAGCSEGSTTTLVTRFYVSDNPDLPEGEYHGTLHLIALDWQDKNWSANMNVDLHLNI